ISERPRGERAEWLRHWREYAPPLESELAALRSEKEEWEHSWHGCDEERERLLREFTNATSKEGPDGRPRKLREWSQQLTSKRLNHCAWYALQLEAELATLRAEKEAILEGLHRAEYQARLLENEGDDATAHSIRGNAIHTALGLEAGELLAA